MENENMFAQIIGEDKTNEINIVKKNKAFALKLIEDLNNFFHTNYNTKDREGDCLITCRSRPNYQWNFSFVADKNGVQFSGSVSGYHTLEEGHRIKTLGKLYEKYKDCKGTQASECYGKKSNHGTVYFTIPINIENAQDALKDIFYLFEFDGFSKRF